MNNLSNKKNRNLFGVELPEIIYQAIQLVGIFLITFVLLYIFGLVPETFKSIKPQTVDTESTNSIKTTEEHDEIIAPESMSSITRPSRITINSIGVDSAIEQPSSNNIEVLDEALKKGAVYYPGSGTIESGNIFLFGHSTNWKIVNNQAYKTFNNLDKLKKEDEIIIKDEYGKAHVYEVEKVSLVDENTAFVSFENTGRRLTISTCNTFGEKQERWVVEAKYKEKSPL